MKELNYPKLISALSLLACLLVSDKLGRHLHLGHAFICKPVRDIVQISEVHGKKKKREKEKKKRKRKEWKRKEKEKNTVMIENWVVMADQQLHLWHCCRKFGQWMGRDMPQDPGTHRH